jgi:hypothetical protein
MKSHVEFSRLSVLAALVFVAATLATQAQTGQNLVVNGDFESGNSGFTSGYAFGDVSNPGGYSIGTSPATAPGGLGDWCTCGDHTTGSGNMMIVNGATNAGLSVWEQVVHVTPSTNYTFSYWGAEVDHDSNSLPHLLVSVNGKAIGDSTFPEYSPDNGGKWQNYSFRWNSGPSQTADLVIVDQNTDAPWNDFAIDDISFIAVPVNAGSTPAVSRNAAGNGSETSSSAAAHASTSGQITSHAQVTIKDEQGVEISLKQEEKIALMFVEAIASMEDDCDRHVNRRCPVAELVAGPKSPDWNIDGLKYDPVRDTNYKYAVTITGRGWTGNAVPQRAGLSGFFVDGSKGLIVDTYYKANEPATATDRKLGEISIAGEIFQLH